MGGGLEGLEVQVSGLSDLIEALREENKDDHKEIKAGLQALNGRVRNTEVELARVHGLDDRVQQNEVDIARVRERQNVMTALSSGIAVIASAIAAWLGVKQ